MKPPTSQQTKTRSGDGIETRRDEAGKQLFWQEKEQGEEDRHHGILQKEERGTKTHDGATLLSAGESVCNGDAQAKPKQRTQQRGRTGETEAHTEGWRGGRRDSGRMARRTARQQADDDEDGGQAAFLAGEGARRASSF